MSLTPVRGSNQCDCTHLLRDHEWDGRSQAMTCAICGCAEYAHTPDKALTPVQKPINISKATNKSMSTNTEEVKDMAAEKVAEKILNQEETSQEQKQPEPEKKARGGRKATDGVRERDKVYDRTKPQHPGRKCMSCGSNKTAYQINGRERWHKPEGGFASPEDTQVLCERCRRQQMRGQKAKAQPQAA